MHIFTVLSAVLSTLEIVANIKGKGKVLCCWTGGVGAEDERRSQLPPPQVGAHGVDCQSCFHHSAYTEARGGGGMGVVLVGSRCYQMHHLSLPLMSGLEEHRQTFAMVNVSCRPGVG